MTAADAEQRPPRRRRRPAAARKTRTDVFDAEVTDTPRTGAKRTVMEIVGQLPNYLRLLFGLTIDQRVNVLDKALLVGAIVYIISPADLIPDFIPFLGQVDDVFLLTVAIERLITNAGRAVVLSHWRGNPTDLSRTNLRRAIMAASFFLPRRMRRRLRVLGRRP